MKINQVKSFYIPNWPYIKQTSDFNREDNVHSDLLEPAKNQVIVHSDLFEPAKNQVIVQRDLFEPAKNQVIVHRDLFQLLFIIHAIVLLNCNDNVDNKDECKIMTTPPHMIVLSGDLKSIYYVSKSIYYISKSVYYISKSVYYIFKDSITQQQ
jgi:hypothetical protein